MGHEGSSYGSRVWHLRERRVFHCQCVPLSAGNMLLTKRGNIACNSCAQLRAMHDEASTPRRTYANCHLTKMLHSKFGCASCSGFGSGCCCHSCHNLSSRPRLGLAWLGLALSRAGLACCAISQSGQKMPSSKAAQPKTQQG